MLPRNLTPTPVKSGCSRIACRKSGEVATVADFGNGSQSGPMALSPLCFVVTEPANAILKCVPRSRVDLS